VFEAQSRPESGAPSPLMGEDGSGWATRSNPATYPPYPHPQNPAYPRPITPYGGLQANGGGVSRVGNAFSHRFQGRCDRGTDP
jgi:hypothetical protein